MPIAQPDHARTLRDLSVVIAVLGNDEGSNLSVAGYTLPPWGTLALNPDQSFTYTPAPGFFGTDGFAYTVRDQLGGTSEGEVTIVVARPNSSPEAANDLATTLAGSSVAIPVLANDNDSEGDPLAIIGIDAPAHGTIAVQADQSIRYTPQPGFDGIDSFTYTVGDGAGAISTANVTVAVALPNAPPRALADQAGTIENVAVTIDALANDNDPEGGPITLAGMALPGHGGLTLTAEQRFVYTPEPGYVGADSFTYTIRDEQGAASTGTVTVAVARQNAPPAANADSIVSTGQPVTLNPLANDSDPDGDPLRLTALTLPIKGQIAPNADGSVTYTPPMGFTGEDGFTYQVGDGTTVSEGEVTVSVTAPAVPTYANGYRFRRRIVLPAQTAAAETVADFVLLVREFGAWLKPVAAGGAIQHPQAFDLRFELENGTRLDHELERYDATGSLLAWVRLPNWDLASQQRLVLYYGKPGMAVPEANPAAVWSGYLAVLDARTGVDRSGANRGLAPSGIGAGTLLGDAGAYSGASVATRADASFLSGHAALTVQALIAPDAATVGSNHGVLAQGPMNGTDASAGLALQYLAQSGDGTRNVIHFKVAASDGAAFVVSGADAQRTGQQLLHGVWRQGEAARLHLDGVELPASSTSVVRTGATALPAGGLYLGAGARDPATGGWGGLIDEVRFAAAAFSPARIAAEARNLGPLQALYGLGGEDRPEQSDAAPVAVPVTAAVTTGSSVDIDVAASAYDPDGPGLPEIVAAGAPAHGVATVVAGKVRYTPFAGYVGPDRLDYTLDNAGKQSSSNVQIQVNVGTELRPKLPPAAARVLRVPEDHATFALAYAAARGGDHISLASGTYSGAINLNRSFPLDAPVVIRSRITTGAEPGAMFTGKITVTAPGHWLHEIQTNYNGSSRLNADVTINTSHVWVTRCWLRGRSGIQISKTSHHIWNGWCRFTGRNTPTSGGKAPNCFQWFMDLPDGGQFTTPTAGPYDIYLYRSYFWDDTDHRNYPSDPPELSGGESMHIYIGHSHPKGSDLGRMQNVVIEENLVVSAAAGLGRMRSIYVKRSCDIVRNKCEVTVGFANNRHGWGARIYGNRFVTFQLQGDLRAGSYANGHDIRNNIASKWTLFAGTDKNKQAADWTTMYANSDRCRLASSMAIWIPLKVGPSTTSGFMPILVRSPWCQPDRDRQSPKALAIHSASRARRWCRRTLTVG